VSIELVLGAALAIVAVFFVARPFLREPSPATDVLDDLDDREKRRLELVEERDRALAALKELELDHRTGKVSGDDYRALVGTLRRQAAAALRALDPPRELRSPEPEPRPQARIAEPESAGAGDSSRSSR
jgi:hypothetical protein